jgi:SRSO17 transposase
MAVAKAGKESVGVARQYNGNAGKVDNCQVSVFAALSNKKRYALIGARLYLPRSWAGNPRRCRKAGIPPAERPYRSKTQLALELVDEAHAAGVNFERVTADAIYGGSEFAHALDARGIEFSLDIKSDQGVYLCDPKPAVCAAKSTMGRTPTALKSKERKLRVSSIAKRIRKQQWRRICIWKGSKGYIRVDAVAMRVYFWSRQYPYAPSLWWLVITREVDSKEIKFFISNATAESTLFALVAKHRSRFWIERSFQDSKSCLGMADYQVRKWQAWQHHMSLCMLALLFTLKLKLVNRTAMPQLSCEDVVLAMQHYLAKRILTEQDLEEVINKRHKKRHDARVSALRRQKRQDRQRTKVPK